jgi:hypothetical protein
LKIYETRWGNRAKFIANLTKREAYILRKLGSEFIIEDVDEKTGSVWFKVKGDFNMTTTTSVVQKGGDSVCSFRLWVGRGDWERFKVLCRERGLSVCRVLSDFVRAVCFAPDLVESPGGVKIVNVFLGRPRSRLERKLWDIRLRMTGLGEENKGR